MATKKPLVVIVGETASGKSSLAIKIASQYGGEVISADSWAVYRGFDIGTAKPTLDEQKDIKFHLIDVADPTNGYSAAEFKRSAIDAIEAISKNHRLPIMTGGTGLYIDSVLYDYSFMPAGEIKLREALNALPIEELITITKDKNINLKGIDTRNKRRLIRLIESDGERPKKSKLRPNTLIIGLKTEQANLNYMIRQRTEDMFRKGLETEARLLAKKYGWDVEPMKGIGYREFRDYFSGRTLIRDVQDKISTSTLQLAKKQRTWFKRNKSIHWVSSQAEALELVHKFLNKQSP